MHLFQISNPIYLALGERCAFSEKASINLSLLLESSLICHSFSVLSLSCVFQCAEANLRFSL